MKVKSGNESHSVMSDSLQSCGLYSLLNSTSQTTEVGSCSLRQVDLPNPGIEPRSTALQVDFFFFFFFLPAELSGKSMCPCSLFILYIVACTS